MSLSLTGVARLSKGNIGGEVRRLHGPTRKDAGTAVNGITHFYGNLSVLREPDVHSRTEADEANAFATEDGIAGPFPRDDATGDQTGNLFEFDVTAGSGESEDVLLVLGGGLRVPRSHEFAGAVVHFGDGAGHWRAVYVDVPDGEEDANAGEIGRAHV